MTAKAILLMGSKSDLPHAEKIISGLTLLGIQYDLRIASAHKTPAKLLQILEAYEQTDIAKVYITIAGRSNALSGMVDAQVQSPVIACPPPSNSYSGADIYSSLRMPSGVAPMVVLEPENAALAAAKILALTDPAIREKLVQYQQQTIQKVLNADDEIQP